MPIWTSSFRAMLQLFSKIRMITDTDWTETAAYFFLIMLHVKQSEAVARILKVGAWLDSKNMEKREVHPLKVLYSHPFTSTGRCDKFISTLSWACGHITFQEIFHTFIETFAWTSSPMPIENTYTPTYCFLLRIYKKFGKRVYLHALSAILASLSMHPRRLAPLGCLRGIATELL